MYEEKKEKERTSIMPGPYPPPYEGKLTAYFKFAIGDPVMVMGMKFSGVITWAAVHQTGGYIYLVDDGDTEKWLAESFLQLNMPPRIGPLLPEQPLTGSERK